MTERIPFGRILRTARKQKRWKQCMVACKLEVHTHYYGRLERGEQLPSVPVFARLIDVLELDADELLATVPISEPHATGESPEVRRLLARLRKARPAVQRIIRHLLVELERQ